VNIFQGLRRIIHERSLDIAMFKAIGAGPSQIRRIFFLEGIAIGGIGSAIGTCFGLLVAANINRLITLASSLFGSGLSPQLFYVARIPVELIPHEVVLVASFGLFSAIFAATGASKSVLEINPLQVLGRE
jgi:lipoprotein-releasing system permease protein